MTGIEGAAALVTGGGSGIGRATALLLAERGAQVLVVDVQGERAEQVAAEIAAAGGAATALRTDVTDERQVAAMVDRAVAAFGRLDIAVNNAGTTGTFAPVADVPLADWEHTMLVNLTSVFLCLRAEVPAMLAGGGGAVVNTSSGAGLMGFPGLAAYVASKHAVIGLTRSVALEQARNGIRVNAVCPGTVRTPMLEGFTGGNEEALAHMGKAMPIGRLASSEEIAAAIVWLASPDSSYVTGHALAVDGGAAAQ